jgi:hypothetical protein
MGMRTFSNAKTGGTYASGGTSSFPVTGFPASAYLGNNRRVGGGQQSQPSPMLGGLGQALAYDPKHSLAIIVILVVVGYALWHIDNK